MCIFVRRRIRTRTRTMVPPRCRLRVFGSGFVPWFRPCPSMCVFLVSSCSSLHGFVHVYVCVSSYSSSYSYHGPAQVSFARRTGPRLRTRTMVPPRCRLRGFVPWFRPCPSMCVFLVLSCSSLHGFVHVYVCVSSYSSSSSYSYHGPAQVSFARRTRPRPRTRTMVPPRCWLRGFSCVFVPWFRPFPSMCVFLVSTSVYLRPRRRSRTIHLFSSIISLPRIFSLTAAQRC